MPALVLATTAGECPWEEPAVGVIVTDSAAVLTRRKSVSKTSRAPHKKAPVVWPGLSLVWRRSWASAVAPVGARMPQPDRQQ